MTQDISLDLLNKNGVYKITNTSKNRFYIGSTSQGFLKRFKQQQTNINRTNLKYV